MQLSLGLEISLQNTLASNPTWFALRPIPPNFSIASVKDFFNLFGLRYGFSKSNSRGGVLNTFEASSINWYIIYPASGTIPPVFVILTLPISTPKKFIRALTACLPSL